MDTFSIRQLLEQVDEAFSRCHFPLFEPIKGIRGAPLRHPYMAATIWYLAQGKPSAHTRVLEIGTFVGSSLLTWVEALNRYSNGPSTVYGVDPLESFLGGDQYTSGHLSKVGEIENAVRFDFAYQILKRNIEAVTSSGARCVHLRCFSSDVLPVLRPSCFDLIYVDGNHGYDAVLQDLRQAGPLVADGGILCGDDLELQLDECDVAAAKSQSAVDFVADPRTGVSFHPGVTLAVWEVLGRVSAWDGFWAMQRRGESWVPISLAGAPLIIPSHFPSPLAAKVREALPRMRAACDDGS